MFKFSSGFPLRFFKEITFPHCITASHIQHMLPVNSLKKYIYFHCCALPEILHCQGYPKFCPSIFLINLIHFVNLIRYIFEQNTYNTLSCCGIVISSSYVWLLSQTHCTWVNRSLTFWRRKWELHRDWENIMPTKITLSANYINYRFWQGEIVVKSRLRALTASKEKKRCVKANERRWCEWMDVIQTGDWQWIWSGWKGKIISPLGRQRSQVFLVLSINSLCKYWSKQKNRNLGKYKLNVQLLLFIGGIVLKAASFPYFWL